MPVAYYASKLRGAQMELFYHEEEALAVVASNEPLW